MEKLFLFIKSDEEIAIHAGTLSRSNTQRSDRKRFTPGSNIWKQPKAFSSLDDKLDNVNKGESVSKNSSSSSDELKKMRFNYHRTAFDIDIDEEESRPWRLPYTDLTDFFNYGFDEVTWKVY